MWGLPAAQASYELVGGGGSLPAPGQLQVSHSEDLTPSRLPRTKLKTPARRRSKARVNELRADPVVPGGHVIGVAKR